MKMVLSMTVSMLGEEITANIEVCLSSSIIIDQQQGSAFISNYFPLPIKYRGSSLQYLQHIRGLQRQQRGFS